jgi:hypothetical protein
MSSRKKSPPRGELSAYFWLFVPQMIVIAIGIAGTVWFMASR